MAFNALINSIAPIATPSDWVRPSDWITITDVADEVQFLVADVNAKAFAITTTFIKNSGTNIYIDWGDGVIDTISTETSVVTNHVYSTGGTPCSRGYNTFKIRIYGDATCKITNARHISNFAATGGSPFYNIGLLEAYFGDNTCNTNAFLPQYFISTPVIDPTTSGYFGYLEYAKLPSTVTWTNQLSYMFNGCNILYKVVMPTSASSLTDVSLCFYGCNSLLDVSLPSDATGITSLNSTFYSCTNLRTISFPTSLNSCSVFYQAFVACHSLKNITLPSINAANSLLQCFSSCSSLQWVRFTSMPSPVFAGTTVNFTQFFQNCFSLQNVYFPSTCSSNAVYNCSGLFNACTFLKNVKFPTNFNASDLSTAFQNCSSLTSVTFDSPMPNLTTMATCFSSCRNLVNVTLPATVSASGIALNNAFASCNSLQSITIPSGWTITTLLSTFNGCNNITSIVLPNNAQNSCTSMVTMANNCIKLKTIVMPTSLTLVNTLSNAFYGCSSLTSVTFPATMNAVTTAQAVFRFCYGLTSVTMPTSMTACTNFTDAFSNCSKLVNLTMPTTVSSSLTAYNYLVFSCTNLKTLTLPTTRTSALISINQFFTYCGSLTTINNLNLLGSLTATPRIDASLASGTSANASYTNLLTSLSFSFPMTRIDINGSSATNFNKLNSLRLLNASAGQWTGSFPHINVSFCDLSTAALNILFADIAAQGTVTSKTIIITGCTGAAGLTAADRLVLTSRGWTITG